VVFSIEIERENDGRWLAEVRETPAEFLNVQFQAA